MAEYKIDYADLEREMIEEVKRRVERLKLYDQLTPDAAFNAFRGMDRIAGHVVLMTKEK